MQACIFYPFTTPSPKQEMQHVQKEQNEIKLEIKDSGNGKKKFYNEIFNEDRE